MQQVKSNKTPQLQFAVLLGAAASVILVLTITPWNIVPTMVTEDITVIAVTEHGCVGESVLGHSVVVSGCEVSVGDTVSASFYTPAMTQNGYYEKVKERLAVVNP